MRKEFEQAVVNMYVSHGVPPEDAAAFLETGSNGYRSVSTKSAWWAWQASRECLVIELPDVSDMKERAANGNCYSAARLDQHALVIKYIHAAGVQTK